MATIMTVISDDSVQEQVAEALGRHDGWQLVATTPGQARKDFEDVAVDVAVIGFDSSEGERLMSWVRDQFPTIPVILLTTDDFTDGATVEALVLGAASYVPQSMVASNLAVTVERILGLRGCRRRHRRLLDSLHHSKSFYRLSDNDLAMVEVLVGHLADTAEEFNVCTNGKRLQFSVALEEALCNGIIHGNLGIDSAAVEEAGTSRYEEVERRRKLTRYHDKVVRVTAQFKPGIAQISITDDGEGFDLEEVDDPTRTANLDKPYGRGLLLIRTFMDDVEFNEKGNEIRMIKRNHNVAEAETEQDIPAMACCN